MAWQRDQVLALAPDSASMKAAQKLTSTSKWPTLGADDGVALWGECQGSGKTPYRTAVDLGDIAFKCSCPSRKFPCKHALALFLLYTEVADSFAAQTAPPDWVQSWLAGRSKRKSAQSTNTASTETPLAASSPAPSLASSVPIASATDQSDDNPQVAPKTVNAKAQGQHVVARAQQQRAAARAQKVASGIEELTIWLNDLVRGGFVDAQGRPYTYWQQMAARLIDAQAPGLAGQVEALGAVVASGEGWADRLTGAVGRLFLLLEAYQRLETLPMSLQQDVRTLIGWHQSREEVLAGEAAADQWRVLSYTVEQEEKLISQRVWLQGIASEQYALILNFAHPSNRQSLDAFWRVGTVVDATIFYYQSTVPLRALATDIVVKSDTFQSMEQSPTGMQLLSVTTAFQQIQKALALNPWLTRFPLTLATVVPEIEQQSSAWQASVRDQTGHCLPISRKSKALWQLLSITGGHPAHLFGEWLDDGVSPLGLWYEGRYWAL